ncbi:MAG: rhodanese-like domain-containing protein [Candidatus Marsarchaeota archaeon]|nr:rhodanese-like domain-containing protein [Candidatus Marsarchaeota archaeon]MCL5102081.1 rhodanese-like domain-containing protein [Candidatus Marsarchaeota archaeon]
MENLEFEQALETVKSKGTKIVWLGNEPLDYIKNMLNLEGELLTAANPMELLRASKEELLKYEGHVFMCYHGNTSAFVSEMLKENHGIETFNLKGGITALVGEIF